MSRKIKLCLIGNSSVGKSSIVLQLLDKTFNPDLKTTLGLDYRWETKTINKERVTVEIWDTSGQ